VLFCGYLINGIALGDDRGRGFDRGLGAGGLGPEGFQLFERAALGFRNELPHEEGGEDAHDAIDPIGESVVELFHEKRIVVEDGKRPTD